MMQCPWKLLSGMEQGHSENAGFCWLAYNFVCVLPPRSSCPAPAAKTLASDMGQLCPSLMCA